MRETVTLKLSTGCGQGLVDGTRLGIPIISRLYPALLTFFQFKGIPFHRVTPVGRGEHVMVLSSK